VPQFWLLMATFFVCGYTSNGMVLTHFMPHALEHNFSELQASTALGVMGAMNVLGTVGSGWICDRFGRRGPLAFYYFVRGLSLLFLLYVWNAPSLHLWAAIFGLNYISTVPPTTTLIANIFGRYSVGELSGWIFFSHQVGAALGAAIDLRRPPGERLAHRLAPHADPQRRPPEGHGQPRLSGRRRAALAQAGASRRRAVGPDDGPRVDSVAEQARPRVDPLADGTAEPARRGRSDRPRPLAPRPPARVATA